MLVNENTFNFDDLKTPVIGDLGEDPTRGQIFLALNQYNAAYIPTAFEDNPSLLILFTTIYGKPGFYLPSVLDAAREAKHDVLILGDKRREFLLTGIDSWDMNMFECIAAIERFAKAFGKTKINTLGHSSGGVTALAYACLMNVSQAILFNTPTFIFQAAEGSERLRDTLGLEVKDLIQDRNVLNLPEGERSKYLDFRNWINDRRSPKTEIQFHFSKGQAGHYRHARHVAGLNSVTPIPYDYRHHDLTNHLHQEGRLTEVLTTALT